jgi:ribonuclease-3
MQELQSKLNYKFKDEGLIRTALTHSSYANEHRCQSNERLEFLGDSILGMVVATYLYRNYPDLPEGKMTRLRAELVCEQSLWGVASKMGFGENLRLGKGEELSGGRERHSILADCVEAVIAAMYLDGGFDVAKRFIMEHILSDIEDGRFDYGSDYKTQLQELVQQKPGQTMTYVMVAENRPDHMKSFTVRVELNGMAMGTGEGHTKKEAEQNAAKHALEGMKNR